ncbi:Fur family transcriptional regulator [Haliangium ochraceum]|uniref:Ferric uptake regulator, Fur family n=1 Tax=Haliangium ochraceum (strain DSM 14365 / JCM 11303 / SMP-2) TaxID=502025 RepID=D0LR17_HALO1|nr:Fur family transcriptional regulator [Haliangium ochraceum]ACY15525.1 ferric uptake regulator, Fur family [Haliangium ochraceum DSM 14365]
MASKRQRELDELRTSLREAGLRATASRVAVLSLLRAQTMPMSHGEAFAQLEADGWDRATIYRNLIDLTDAGLARRSEVGDRVWRFEATSGDATHDNHPHFVCTECSTIECLPELSLRLPARVHVPRSVAEKHVEVQLRGLCDDCG